MNKGIMLILLASALMTSCVTSRRVNYLQQTTAYPQADSIADYRLQFGDQVYIRVATLNDEAAKLFSGSSVANSTMNTSDGMNNYSVMQDSCINFPFAGCIKLAGQTLREARETTRTALKDLVPDCDVEVRLANNYFTIIGNAGTGRYNITGERLNIMQALAISGDLKDFSDRKRVKIIRPTSTGTVVREFDVRSKDIINSEFYYVMPNDVLYVQSFNGQFFGVKNLGVIISSVTTVASLGYLLYHLIAKPATKK